MYRRLNAALRAHDLVELGPYLPFMKLLLSALYKLPLVQAKVYRGVKLDLHEVRVPASRARSDCACRQTGYVLLHEWLL